MNRLGMLLSAAGLAVAVGVWTADAQPPQGDRRPPRPGDRERPEPKADAQVEAWVTMLSDKIADPHDVIRDSARAALVAVGRPALPTLRRLADGDDSAKATAARRVAEAIEHGRDGRPDGDRRPDGPPRGDRGEASPIVRALGELKLNEKQTQQANEAREKFELKMREVREAGGDPMGMREKLRPAHEAMLTDMKTALGDELFEQFQDALRKLGPPGGRGGRGPGG